MINVTKSFLPPIEEYEEYLKKIWNKVYLTNQGPLLRELETKLKQFLNVENFHVVTNGTVALQLAINALDITDGEIITTPFSFVATTTTIMWERCTPVFVDIEPDNFCIDPEKIEAAITDNTKAILAVHVFGYPCNIEKIQEIADRHNLKVIYDAAHAFAVNYKGKSLLSYGDISTCSFHATKVFHTVEGGACIVKDKAVSDKVELTKRFGFNIDDYQEVGINAKSSEFHAAMGLANLKYIKEVIEERKKATDLYDELLKGYVQRPKNVGNLEYNYAYYPVVFNSERDLLDVINSLKKEEISARRYFYPSLNKLPYLKSQYDCPISEDISSRIACLPLYPDLSNEDVITICNIVKKTLREKEDYCLTKNK